MAEGLHLSVWDLARTPACVARRVVGEAPTTCITSNEHFVAVAGHERSVYVYEPRCATNPTGRKKKEGRRKRGDKKRSRKKG